jgi:hypothetical protein
MLDLNRMLMLKRRLVEELGLQSTLREYNVPKEDIPKIAQGLGGKDVEELLDGIYGLNSGIGICVSRGLRVRYCQRSQQRLLLSSRRKFRINRLDAPNVLWIRQMKWSIS